MNTDTRCPGCGRANTIDPGGECHSCGHGRPDPAAAALREQVREIARVRDEVLGPARDRKSTRLNSSHGYISYAVFCLKKKKKSMKNKHKSKKNGQKKNQKEPTAV